MRIDETKYQKKKKDNKQKLRLTLSWSGSKEPVHDECSLQLPSSLVCLTVGMPPPLRNSSGPAYMVGGSGASTDTRNPSTSSCKVSRHAKGGEGEQELGIETLNHRHEQLT